MIHHQIISNIWVVRTNPNKRSFYRGVIILPTQTMHYYLRVQSLKITIQITINFDPPPPKKKKTVAFHDLCIFTYVFPIEIVHIIRGCILIPGPWDHPKKTDGSYWTCESGKKKKGNPHRINVWHICLHLVDLYGKCRIKYIQWPWIGYGIGNVWNMSGMFRGNFYGVGLFPLHPWKTFQFLPPSSLQVSANDVSPEEYPRDKTNLVTTNYHGNLRPLTATLGILAHLLRMVSWNLIALRFGGDCTPQTIILWRTVIGSLRHGIILTQHYYNYTPPAN